MDDAQPNIVTAEFDVTGWDDVLYFESEDAEGPKLGRATVRKTFTGAVQGTSVAELLTAGGAEARVGRGHVASELFDGSINGRKGTVVFQHGGIDDGRGGAETFGNIVLGTGSGELAGLRGTIAYRHDESGAVVTLNLRVAG
jgi:Protein of unknown function (DUF3224)